MDICNSNNFCGLTPQNSGEEPLRGWGGEEGKKKGERMEGENEPNF
jgi:hypothetical protein